MKKLNRKYSSVKEMKNDGWTDEELQALANGPRSKAASWDEEHTYFRWPSIDGISIVGLFSLLTREEKDAYNKYHSKHKPTGLGSGSSSNKELLEKWSRLEEFCKDKPEALTLIAEMKPKSKFNLIEEMFGVDSIQQLKSKVSLAYVMYRGKDNEFIETEDASKVTLKDFIIKYDDNFQCKFTKQQVLDNVQKLKKNGIDISNVIVGL